jgi:uracil-DNA glycosylase
LTELLESIGLSRSDVFITNIVKCRPPSNRAPRKPEVESCKPFLMAQIRLIKPQIVCALGTPAITTLLGEKHSATKTHGRKMTNDSVTILPMYHPAAALYDASLKEILASDFKTLKKLIETIPRPGKITSEQGGMKAHDSLEKWV